MSMDLTVLVVDDEVSVSDALELILSDHGCQVVVSASGNDALVKAKELRFDLAIVDVGLRDMSGLDVLRHLREEDPGLQVIIITANATPAIVRQAKERGAADCLQKPFLAEDIVDAIRRLWRQP